MHAVSNRATLLTPASRVSELMTQRPKPRQHRGDIMSSEKRSALMFAHQRCDTGPERIVADAFRQMGFSWDGHPRDLPGCPDYVFRICERAGGGLGLPIIGRLLGHNDPLRRASEAIRTHFRSTSRQTVRLASEASLANVDNNEVRFPPNGQPFGVKLFSG
jgi:DNA mismatch endonuclease Vsr